MVKRLTTKNDVISVFGGKRNSILRGTNGNVSFIVISLFISTFIVYFNHSYDFYSNLWTLCVLSVCSVVYVCVHVSKCQSGVLSTETYNDLLVKSTLLTPCFHERGSHRIWPLLVLGKVDNKFQNGGFQPSSVVREVPVHLMELTIPG